MAYEGNPGIGTGDLVQSLGPNELLTKSLYSHQTLVLCQPNSDIVIHEMSSHIFNRHHRTKDSECFQRYCLKFCASPSCPQMNV